MELNRKYSFNLPWRLIVLGTGFYLGLAIWMASLAGGVLSAALSGMFVILALIMGTRRLFRPRVLELTEDAVLFPEGFLMTRIVRIQYVDVIRIIEVFDKRSLSICMDTENGSFEIACDYLPDIRTYFDVRKWIYTKALIARKPSSEAVATGQAGWMESPGATLYFKEPEDWALYRTHLFMSKPLYVRLAGRFWYFVCCFGVIVGITCLPWLAMFLSGWADRADYLSFGLLPIFISSVFFTLVDWLSAAFPVSSGEISFRPNGLSQFFGKQTHHWNYRRISGWNVVERVFEGRTLLILLLQSSTLPSRPYVFSLALPDTIIRDQVMQILGSKQIPHAADLKPPWETGL